MESINESIEISQEKVEPNDLLDNSWFFNNLFNTKRTPVIIPRCYSDPSPSPSSSFSPNFIDHQVGFFQEKSMEEAFPDIKKVPIEAGRFSPPEGLTRAPSLPEESAPQRVRKSNLQRSSNSIYRAPSVPASMIISEEIQDDESDFSMSRLIRQASLNQSDLLLPPRGSPKVVTRSPSTPLQRPKTKADTENVSSTKSSEVRVRRQQHQNSGSRLGRSSSDMVTFQELLGFRDLSIEKTKEPSSVKECQEQSISPTQVTEQWGGDKRRSVEEDMKAQIKFWARTVASNVK